MPKLGTTTDGEETYAVGGTHFTFKAARIGDLGATEYTLALIAVDVTWSVEPFAAQLREMLITAVEACKKSPRSDNLLLRVVLFSSFVGVQELHGYKRLSEIDTSAYPQLAPEGMTNLFDATFSGIGSMAEYGRELAENDFLANGIVFVITDGMNNRSTATAAMIRRQVEDIRRAEELESLMSILIGVNAAEASQWLDDFKREAGLDQFIDAGDATPGKLAKVAAFVSQSVSSTSQALGTGGPSQSIAAVI